MTTEQAIKLQPGEAVWVSSTLYGCPERVFPDTFKEMSDCRCQLKDSGSWIPENVHRTRELAVARVRDNLIRRLTVVERQIERWDANPRIDPRA